MTTKVLKQIEELARDGWCDAEIARRIGRRPNVVRSWRVKLGIPVGKNGKKMQGHYMVYNRWTTEFLAEGNARECAAALGMKVASFYCAVSNWRNQQRGKYEIYEVQHEV